MWQNLLRVDWAKLTHAYGRAHTAPRILHNMFSPISDNAERGWDEFWGAINHQGDFYDSTVAFIPFLIEVAADPDSPKRVEVLNYLCSRWNDASEYGGDPVLDTPPGGVDSPTPMLSDQAFEEIQNTMEFGSNYDICENIDDFDTSEYRSMDLCAWQTGRAILEGKDVYVGLLDDEDPNVVAAAAELLMLWSSTRPAAKRVMIQAIEDEDDAVQQAVRILNYGIWGDDSDVPKFEAWTALDCYAPVRAAAALAWACVVNPNPLPEQCREALDQTSAPDSSAFAELPWEGIYHRGPWILPDNIADLVPRLAENKNDELRWRAVQGLSPTWSTSARVLTKEQMFPVLKQSLADTKSNVRAAATYAISQHGDFAFRDAELVELLIDRIDDEDASCAGHAARLLVTQRSQLSESQIANVRSKVRTAARRFGDDEDVWFDSMAMAAPAFFREKLEELDTAPSLPSVAKLFETLFHADCDMEDQVIPTDVCDRSLADAFAEDPEAVRAVAIDLLRKAGVNAESDLDNVEAGVRIRDAAIGVALWAQSIGPAVAPMLAALDAYANSPIDDYAKQVGTRTVTFAREAIGVSGPVERPIDLTGLPSAELLDKLADDASQEFGVTGRFELDGRLYTWRKEYSSVRNAALTELLNRDDVPAGREFFEAMLDESIRPRVVCGGTPIAHTFTMSQWRKAVSLAGGFENIEQTIREARQRYRSAAWNSDGEANGDELADANVLNASAAQELGKVIRKLSGRMC